MIKDRYDIPVRALDVLGLHGSFFMAPIHREDLYRGDIFYHNKTIVAKYESESIEKNIEYGCSFNIKTPSGFVSFYEGGSIAYRDDEEIGDILYRVFGIDEEAKESLRYCNPKGLK
jgi:hypothetical protein